MSPSDMIHSPVKLVTLSCLSKLCLSLRGIEETTQFVVAPYCNPHSASHLIDGLESSLFYFSLNLFHDICWIRLSQTLSTANQIGGHIRGGLQHCSDFTGQEL